MKCQHPLNFRKITLPPVKLSVFKDFLAKTFLLSTTQVFDFWPKCWIETPIKCYVPVNFSPKSYLYYQQFLRSGLHLKKADSFFLQLLLIFTHFLSRFGKNMNKNPIKPGFSDSNRVQNDFCAISTFWVMRF